MDKVKLIYLTGLNDSAKERINNRDAVYNRQNGQWKASNEGQAFQEGIDLMQVYSDDLSDTIESLSKYLEYMDN